MHFERRRFSKNTSSELELNRKQAVRHQIDCVRGGGCMERRATMTPDWQHLTELATFLDLEPEEDVTATNGQLAFPHSTPRSRSRPRRPQARTTRPVRHGHGRRGSSRARQYAASDSHGAAARVSTLARVTARSVIAAARSGRRPGEPVCDHTRPHDAGTIYQPDRPTETGVRSCRSEQPQLGPDYH